MQAVDDFNSTPVEIQSHLLSFLDEKSNGRASQVCKAWQKMCPENQIWKCIFPGIEIFAPSHGHCNYKLFVKEKSIKKVSSLAELEPFFKSFCDRHVKECFSVFTCLLPFNLDCQIAVKLGRETPHPDQEEIYLLAAPLETAEGRAGQSCQTYSASHRLNYVFSHPSADSSFNSCFQLASIAKDAKNKHYS